ncbi:BA14K family protein [Neorhizobium lilium]|uniref:Lectin-like protein BA14k n=1 Tax=Neorhizobium lilium TaxID=2503024 RepID=A0A3S3SEL7_9HYPH|nr:BA14K family protein [Neorhizobium lilium]RWX78409.1 BA14K family protein [Neorhizobium lilium]
MKAFMLLLGSLVVVVAIFLGGVYITANMIAEPEPHKFAHIDTPDLWTSRPVKVDGAKQTYERLPSLPIIASIPASDLPEPRNANGNVHTASLVDNTVTSAANTGVEGDDAAASQPGTKIDPAHADWCFARYRSYRVEDNTYQPFSGGSRRQCEEPGSSVAQSVSNASTNAEPQQEQTMASADLVSVPASAGAARDIQASGQPNHAEWCQGRYRSYRVEDNSYQPLDGGPRRNCQSPFG